MSFKMSEEMRRLHHTIDTKSENGKLDMWDVYYFCSIVGMTKGKLGNGNDLKEFSKVYPASYQNMRHSIVAALITAELVRTGQNFEKENITAIFRRLVDDSSLMLNIDGLSTLDKYAEGGLQLVLERGTGIRDRIQFLRECKDVIDE